MINIFLVNNSGGGFADYMDIDEGTDLASLFKNNVDGDIENHLVRVNHKQVSSDYALQEGDRITFTPTKIEGACH